MKQFASIEKLDRSILYALAHVMRNEISTSRQMRDDGDRRHESCCNNESTLRQCHPPVTQDPARSPLMFRRRYSLRWVSITLRLVTVTLSLFFGSETTPCAQVVNVKGIVALPTGCATRLNWFLADEERRDL